MYTWHGIIQHTANDKKRREPETMTKGNKKISRDNHRMKCILIFDRLHQHGILPLRLSLRTQILNNDNRKIHENGTRYPEINIVNHRIVFFFFSFLSNLEIAPRIIFFIFILPHSSINIIESIIETAASTSSEGNNKRTRDDKFFILALK